MQILKPRARTLVLLTPVFILLAHYVAVFPHEFAHSFMAWALGRKDDPLAITWGGDSLRNILLLAHIDENVDYPSAFAKGPAYYVPIRTFSAQDDVANFVHGLGISPWYVYGIGGYLVVIAIVDFLRHGLPRAYERLGLRTTASRSGLMAVSVAILFCYFSTPGFHAGDDVSFFISVTSWIVVPGMLIACWPSREWVIRQVHFQESLIRVGPEIPGEYRG